MSVRLIAEAEADAADAASWYDGQQPGLGQDFLDELTAALEVIEQLPQIGALATPAVPGREVRRRLVNRFPYSVFYEVTGTDAVVLAVSHQRRRPGGWVGRLP